VVGHSSWVVGSLTVRFGMVVSSYYASVVFSYNVELLTFRSWWTFGFLNCVVKGFGFSMSIEKPGQ
jgi:hypothetical protein